MKFAHPEWRIMCKKNFFRADLHGTIFVACGNGLRQAHDMIYDCCVRQKKCRSILKHVLKRCDNRKSCRRPVVSLSHATKIIPCKSALGGHRKARRTVRARGSRPMN